MSKGPLELAGDIITSAKPETISRLSSVTFDVRVRAVNVLLASLDEKKEEDILVFQSIPLGLLQKDDTLGALSYIETVGRNGKNIGWEIFETVVSQAFLHVESCYDNGDENSARVIRSKLRALFRMAETQIAYSQNPRLQFLIGQYHDIDEKFYKAIHHYNEAIHAGDQDAMIAAAHAYESAGNFSMSAELFRYLADITGNPEYLEQLIHVLYEDKRAEEAMVVYSELTLLLYPDTPQPFVIYQGCIDSDSSLLTFERVVSNYLGKEDYTPSEVLAKLSQSAHEYIQAEISIENQKLDSLNKIPIGEFTQSDMVEYSRIISRSLWLLQTDIFTLRHDEYIERYIKELDDLSLTERESSRELLKNHFRNNPSEEVVRTTYTSEAVEMAEMATENEEEIESITIPSFSQKSLESQIAHHIARLGEIFFQGTFYELHRDTIAPLLQDFLIADDEFDEEKEEDMNLALTALKSELDFYEALRPSVRKSYEEFIQYFDRKYGVFYRRNIQSLARDPDVVPEKYPKMLENYSEVAVLFWVEKIIASTMPTDDFDDLDKIVQKYGLEDIKLIDACLLGFLLYEICPEVGLSYFVDFPEALGVAEVLYIVLERLRSVDPSSRRQLITHLHEVTKKKYKAKGFFEHLQYTHRDVLEENPTDEALEYVYLGLANKRILQSSPKTKKEDEQTAISTFLYVGRFHGSVEGIMQAADSYNNRGDIDMAIQLSEEAFCQDENANTLSKILSYTISAGRFEKAKEYLDLGMRNGYELSSYWLSYFLFRGKYIEAMRHMATMIHHGIPVLDVPEGTLKRLFDVCKDIATGKIEKTRDQDSLEVFASYVRSRLVVGDAEVDIDLYLEHWASIESLFGSYEGDALYEIINNIFQSILPDVIGDDDLKASVRAMTYIHIHAAQIHESLKKQMLMAQEKKNRKKCEKIIASIYQFIDRVLVLLKKFPDSEGLQGEWKKGSNFWIIQNKASHSFIKSDPSRSH